MAGKNLEGNTDPDCQGVERVFSLKEFFCRPKKEGEPGRDGDHVDVLHAGDEEGGEGKGDCRNEGRKPVKLEAFGIPIGKQTGEDVGKDDASHEGKMGGEEGKDRVWGVEDSDLSFREDGKSERQIGFPDRQVAFGNSGVEGFFEGKVEVQQVASGKISSHQHDIAKHNFIEKEDG